MNVNQNFEQEGTNQALKVLFRKILQKTLSVDEEKALLKLLEEVPYDLVVAVEQELLAEGYSSEQIMLACDHHIRAVHNVFAASQNQIVEPLKMFILENAILRKLLGLIEKSWKEHQKNPNENSRQKLLSLFEYLQGLHRHYEKKEQILFPFLEKRGIFGPSKVMWAKDDQLRQQFKNLKNYLREETNNLELSELLESFLVGLADMIEKGEKILFPLCREKLSESDWETIAADLKSFPPAFKIDLDELK